MSVIESAKVIKALSKVIDPKTGQSIVSMSMVKDFAVEGNNVNFTLELPTLDNQQKQDLNFACIAAVQELYPDANVNVHVATAGQSQQSQTEQPSAPTSPIPQIKNIIAVASGKGGVGKSTVSVNLALALKNTGAKVGLLDADLYGPSIPTMLGLKGQRPKIQEVYGQARLIPLEAYGIPVMSIGFIIEPEQAVVLRGPRLSTIIGQFINECIWPALDYLIIDLPPGTGDIQLSLVQTVPLTGAVMVTTPQDVATADAIKAANMFLMPSVNVPILGVVENMSWFTPEELPDNKYFIFGQGGGETLAEQIKTPFLGQVPLVQGIREGGDAGKPIVTIENSIGGEYFAKIAENTLSALKNRIENMPPTEIVQVTN